MSKLRLEFGRRVRERRQALGLTQAQLAERADLSLDMVGRVERGAHGLAFDRVELRKAVTLRSRAELSEARAFQKALLGHLLARRAPLMLGTAPEPHLTINYRGDRLGAQRIAPIGWTVDEILLVESVVGKTTYVEHGRWQLRAV